MSSQDADFCVVVPTRDRPEKLRLCLAAIGASRGLAPFVVVVCDSSTSAEMSDAVARVCEAFAFVVRHCHEGVNAAAARNVAADVATTELIVAVDDDVMVEPDAIAVLLDTLRRNPGSMVAGSVRWGTEWSGPVKMRRNGYGRALRLGESADFLVSAFVAYPRALSLLLPWNEHLQREEDRFLCVLWRSHGVSLCFEATARAVHHHEHTMVVPQHLGDHIYVNLFDAVLVRRDLWLATSFLVAGFAHGVRQFWRPHELPVVLASSFGGVGRFLHDARRLRSTVGRYVGQS